MEGYGLYVDNELMTSYLHTDEGYAEALIDAKLIFEHSGISHEIKEY